MKQTLRLSLLFASCFCLSASRAQTANPDTMVRKLFATLPNNDQDGFVALYPTPQQLIELVKNILQSDEVQKQIALSSEGKKVNVDSIIQSQIDAMSQPETVAQMKKSFGQNFQRTVDAGKTKQVDWQQAHFVSYTLDTAVSGTDKDEALLQKIGYKTMKGVIDFSVDTAIYQMQFSKIIFLPKGDGWYGGEFGQIVRKGEQFLQKGETRIEGTSSDTTFITTTTEMPKTKTKANSGNIKTKTKTKSPARKPSTKS